MLSLRVSYRTGLFWSRRYASLYMASPSCASGASPFPDSLSEFNVYRPQGVASELIDLYKRLGTDTTNWSMGFGKVNKELRLASQDGQNQNMVYALLEGF